MTELARLTEAATGASFDDLLAALTSMPPEAGPATLDPLTRRPRLLTHLDAGYRRRQYAWPRPTHATEPTRQATAEPPGQGSTAPDHRAPAAPVDQATAASARQTLAAPVQQALAAMDRDGRVREGAVAAIAADPAAELMPLLVLRCDDWVVPVRAAARDAVDRLLAADPLPWLRAALPMAGHIVRRERGGWVLPRLRAVVADRFDELAPTLITSRDGAERRLAFEVGAGRWTYAELVDFALGERDAMIRLRAAEAAQREAVRRGDDETLRSLAASRFAQVRLLALLGLAHRGRDADVAAAMDDPAPMVRAYARSRAGDPLGHYRATVAEHPTPGALAGLGETGVYRDAALLTPLLDHPDPRLRAAAVRALAALDSTPADRVVPLLRDPAPAVVREAATALRARLRLLPPELPWQLLTDARPELRRAGYRLLIAQDYPTRLRAALLLAADPDPALARNGRVDATRLATQPPWWFEPTADLDELARLADHLDPRLADHVRRLAAR